MTNTKNGSNQGMVSEARSGNGSLQNGGSCRPWCLFATKTAVIFEVNKHQPGVGVDHLKD